jgi:hypothetical protein
MRPKSLRAGATIRAITTRDASGAEGIYGGPSAMISAFPSLPFGWVFLRFPYEDRTILSRTRNPTVLNWWRSFCPEKYEQID